jgi:predicted aminopeptidase
MPLCIGFAIIIAIMFTMKTTSMQLDSKLRDELAEIAERDYQGVPLGEAVRRLVKEHQIDRIIRRYEVLRADPDEWAGYRAEAHLTDNSAGDGLPDARREYPEFNQ